MIQLCPLCWIWGTFQASGCVSQIVECPHNSILASINCSCCWGRQRITCYAASEVQKEVFVTIFYLMILLYLLAIMVALFVRWDIWDLLGLGVAPFVISFLHGLFKYADYDNELRIFKGQQSRAQIYFFNNGVLMNFRDIIHPYKLLIHSLGKIVSELIIAFIYLSVRCNIFVVAFIFVLGNVFLVVFLLFLRLSANTDTAPAPTHTSSSSSSLLSSAMSSSRRSNYGSSQASSILYNSRRLRVNGYAKIPYMFPQSVAVRESPSKSSTIRTKIPHGTDVEVTIRSLADEEHLEVVYPIQYRGWIRSKTLVEI